MKDVIREDRVDLVVVPFAQSRGTPSPETIPFPNVTVSVIIPTINEAENLPHVLPLVPEWVYEVVIVDGHSTDGTPDVARQLWPSVRIVNAPRRGKGAALRAGFEHATGDIIVMLDADGSMDPREIPAFVGMLVAGADFAKGSRFAQGGGTSDMTPFRRFGNWAFVVATRAIFGGQYSDLCYGYNAFWRRILPQLSLDGEGFEIETMMNIRSLRCQLSIVEVPSFEAARIHGTSNLRTMPDGWRVLRTIWREWGATRRLSPRFTKPQTAGYARPMTAVGAGHVLRTGHAE